MSDVSGNCRLSYRRIRRKGPFLISISSSVEVPNKVYVFYTGSSAWISLEFLSSFLQYCGLHKNIPHHTGQKVKQKKRCH